MRRISNLAMIVASGLLAVAAATPAGAAVVTYTYTGTIRDGRDVTGVFGAPRDLTGVGFTAVFRRDENIPGATRLDDGIQTQIFGFMAPAPVWGEITVDGVTWSILDTFGGQTQTEEADFCGPGCDREAFSHTVGAQFEGNSPDGTLYISDRSFMDLSGFGFGTDVLPNRDYRSLPDVLRTDQFAMAGEMRVVASTVQVDGGVLLSDNAAWGYLSPTSVTVTTSAAPEPAAWALMIGGFGFAGAALRRRQALAGRA